MGLTELHVSPLGLPPGSKHQWTFKPNEPGGHVDLARCDLYTQLYDTSWCDRRRTLTLLGPFAYKHWDNRSLDVSLVANESSYDTRLLSAYRARRGRVRLPDRPNDLRVSFQALDLFDQPLAFNTTLPPVKTVITTLQKDNPVIWITDWVRYYQSIGVDRVMIYDNGSSNIDAVRSALSAVSGDIVLIHWPFPYGDPKHSNSFMAQVGALRHATELNHDSGWLLNFDIDEYLVPKHGLTKLLNKRLLIGRLQIPSFRAITSIPEETEIRAGNQIWREKTVGPAAKYIMRLKGDPKPRVHTAVLGFPYRAKTLAITDAYYLHYRGLTTHWKETSKWHSSGQQIDAGTHVQDTSVAGQFAALEENDQSRSL